MTEPDLDLDAYCKRIGIERPRVLDEDALRGIQRAHLSSIPFENLDILAGKGPVSFDPEELFDKLVTRRRGGICYEQNFFFAAVLRQLGARVRFKGGRVNEGGSEFDHVFLLVDLPDAPDVTWVCDVGFSYSFHGPIRLAEGVVQDCGIESYAIRPESDGWRELVRVRPDGSESHMFSFGPAQYAPDDYRARADFYATSPDSRFVRGPLVGIDRGEGRAVLSFDRLTWTEGGQLRERTVPESEFPELLREVFGLN